MTCLDGYNKVLQKQINIYIHTVRAKKVYDLIFYLLYIKIQRKVYLQDYLVPDKAKLERAKPPVRRPTISQGGNPRSSDERVMQNAGDKNAIDWQIFRTYLFKKNSSTKEIKSKSQDKYAQII